MASMLARERQRRGRKHHPIGHHHAAIPSPLLPPGRVGAHAHTRASCEFQAAGVMSRAVWLTMWDQGLNHQVTGLARLRF